MKRERERGIQMSSELVYPRRSRGRCGQKEERIRRRPHNTDVGSSAVDRIRARQISSSLNIYNPLSSTVSSSLGGVLLIGMSSINGCGSGEEESEVHVLAVDDSSVDRAIVAHLLRSSKYRVTTADSGKRALELLGLERNVSMIITDYWMPEMTGFELLKRVKESSELKEIPVVIMSSDNVPNRISRCLEEGAEDFLLKPLRPSDVARLCGRILR